MALPRLTWSEASHQWLASGVKMLKWSLSCTNFQVYQRSKSEDPGCNLEQKRLLTLYWESHFIFLLVSLGDSQLHILYAWWTMYVCFFLFIIFQCTFSKKHFWFGFGAACRHYLNPSPLSERRDWLGLASHVDTYQILCFLDSPSPCIPPPINLMCGGASVSCRTSFDAQALSLFF